MAHEFDTELTVPQRTLLLQGAIGLLSPLLIANGGYIAAIVPFGAVVRSYTDEAGADMLYNALSGSAPAIAVATGSRSSKPMGNVGFKHLCDLELLVYFASTNMTDLATGRMTIDASGAAANSADPGLHVMMEHAEELLVGQRPNASSTFKEIRPDREEELATRENVTIWLQTYQVTLTRSINRHRNVIEQIRSIATRLHPSGAPDAPAPAQTEFVTTISEAP